MGSMVYYLFIYWPYRVACGILVPQRGIKPGPHSGESVES